MKLLCDTFWQKYEAFIKKYVHFSRNKKQLALLVSQIWNSVISAK